MVVIKSADHLSETIFNEHLLITMGPWPKPLPQQLQPLLEPSQQPSQLQLLSSSLLPLAWLAHRAR